MSDKATKRNPMKLQIPRISESTQKERQRKNAFTDIQNDTYPQKKGKARKKEVHTYDKAVVVFIRKSGTEQKPKAKQIRETRFRPKWYKGHDTCKPAKKNNTLKKEGMNSLNKNT